MKKIICCLLAALLLGTCALSEALYESVQLRFEDGFSLSVPADWVSYEVAPELEEDGYLYCLGSADGARLMYVQRWGTTCQTMDELQSLLEQRQEIVLRAAAEDSPFLMYNFSESDGSGCATLLNGDILNLVFIPQSDAENMLIAATIMESFEVDE